MVTTEGPHIITGGFRGHGKKTQIRVDRKTQKRTCGDCGLIWPKEDDSRLPVVVACATEAVLGSIASAA